MAQEKRLWTVRDSVEISYFTPSSESQMISISPDGRFGCVVVSHGKISTDEIKSAIRLYDYAKLKIFLQSSSETSSDGGQLLIEISAKTQLDSESKPSTITELRWSKDGTKLYFLCFGNDHERQICCLDVQTREMTKLSPEGVDVTFYEPLDDGFIFTYSKQTPVAELFQSGGSSLEQIEIGTGKSFLDLLFPNWRLGDTKTSSISICHNGKFEVIRQPNSAENFQFLSRRPFAFLSPDGRYLVFSTQVEQVPSTWEDYEPASVNPVTKFVAADYAKMDSKANWNRPEHYRLLELNSGKISTILDSPRGISAGYVDIERPVAWSADSQTIALSNTFFPHEKESKEPKLLRPVVVAYSLADRKVKLVSRGTATRKESLAYMEWSVGELLNIRYQQKDPESFKLLQGLWQAQYPALDPTEKNGTPSRDCFLLIEEALDKPPLLKAGMFVESKLPKHKTEQEEIETVEQMDLGSLHPEKEKENDYWTEIRKQIFDPNPHLADIDRGKAIEIEWLDKFGKKWSGALMKPPNLIVARKYPLLIQTHGFFPGSFIYDGTWTTASPGRALAARGIVVLQVDDSRSAPESPEESERDGRAGYVSAIEKLANDGLIDPHNVGIVGFSHTGSYVLECLIKSPAHFKAAIMAEADTLSLQEYFNNLDYLSPERVKFIEKRFNTQPFGAGLQAWIDNSPGFNTDKINAPILFCFHDPASLAYGWDIYPALRLQNKPVELLYMRSGGHVLSKPKHRFVSQEMAADWFDFWLNNAEDPEPSKSAQYKRWHVLKHKLGGKPT